LVKKLGALLLYANFRTMEKIPTCLVSRSLAMAKRLGSLLLPKDYREKSNLSCLEELGDGEEAGLPAIAEGL
jgi:hypothetical protein